ncbi:MFS general substrate transporter [Aaosphaeria arxii CBS 175.79]|uniref:MFS general substrate transporter n=1 Tax=Aaosphaeria arxii CBS 175.79 TaxID=1450172 RepID=A0A6A5Y5C9_9PLEO|nr:MFS general substrate transporter [Aaosphaeria arxii CBS 175.79]KAF2020247.1 MFS general substrate transporter [Aaosphaeria arxii CBS 175.79]
MSDKSSGVEHVENAPKADSINYPAHDAEKQSHDNAAGANLELDETALPPGYYRSKFFIGTMAGIGLGLMAGVAAYGYAAPILGIINADIGPDPNVVWVALSYTLTSAVTLTIIGRVSDIFGRRWTFVGGAALGVIGSIICSVAQNVTTLIVGTTIMGIAAATQLSYFYVMGELVPMKYRLAGNAFCYLFCIPGSGVAPVISNAFILYQPSVGWRGCYYVLIGINAASFLCWFLFYHPPTFHMKHGENASVVKYIKQFDYVGTALYTGGLLILMMGLSWGGSVHPWKSAYVIATLVVGFMSLVAFVCWETFMDLKEPLVPMHIFKNYSWNAAVILTGLGASVYYAFAIVWPSMVAVLYADGGPMTAAWLSALVGLCITIGQIVGGFSGKKIGYLKWQCVVGITLGSLFFATMATCGVGTMARASALLSFGVFFVGWTEGAAITIVTLAAQDQFALGTSAGVAGSIRFLISSIAATVFSTVLSNRLAATIAAQVPPAVTAAGLPGSSIASFIAAFAVGPDAFKAVPGITPEILAAGTAAYQHANADAYRTVFLSNIAFSGVAIICALLLPNVDHLLTGQVATTLHKGRDEKTIAGE